MTVILVVHILVSIVLVGVVLLQRSEGGALGVGGGGGGGGGLMSGRGAAGALVRTTIIFGGIFFVTSLVLTTMSSREASDGRTAIERELEGDTGGAAGNPLDVLNDIDAPLLADDPAVGGNSEPAADSQPETAPVGDPLAADIVPEGQNDEETVEDPQP
ncbi:preprotein translocase subunit SecG [Henriciella mobilis]|uniref:Protein-export membrane protein SecG n=1 Tax=Henriciella mobilis TaxID=2305467 RepID=A0A399R9K8_9PROT|nr:preprotein translocase subunit SecG [Henriciella mobilis]RIJ28110.1 preprotein translocase subunit SecG [Henriciella mobilis]